MVVTSWFSELVSTKKGLYPQWGGLPYKKDGELVVNFEKKTYEMARSCPLDVP